MEHDQPIAPDQMQPRAQRHEQRHQLHVNQHQEHGIREPIICDHEVTQQWHGACFQDPVGQLLGQPAWGEIAFDPLQ